MFQTSNWADNLKPLDADSLRPFFDDAASQTADGNRALPSPSKLVRQVAKRRFAHLDKVANAVEHLGQLPAEDEVLHSTMSDNFGCWDLVPAIHQLAGCQIARLDVSTLGFSRENAESLFTMLDTGTIGKTTWLVSSYYKSVDAGIFTDLHAGLTSRGHECHVRRVHAKVLCFALADGRQIVIESSSNLRSCRNLEVFTVHQSPELAAWHRQWMAKLISTGAKK